MLKYGQKIPILNILIPALQLRIINFPEKRYLTQKKPPRIFLDLRVEPILAVFSFNASKLIRVLVFRLFFLRYLASPKNKVIAVNLYQN